MDKIIVACGLNEILVSSYNEVTAPVCYRASSAANLESDFATCAGWPS